MQRYKLKFQVIEIKTVKTVNKISKWYGEGQDLILKFS